jgi:hypothetical protein
VLVGADDPPSVADDPIVAATNKPTVTAFKRFGVSQVMCCACSQLRVALAPVIAANAQPAHIGAGYA